ncbi:LON peptidase N-terminal domain and RING finger protein 1 [Platysternon megacephalum]|uniref:LON peptidase N-terminal domain and RING finger protein 1 n=1 Tax=Platysternon megacephalum TaxID=55544 RepID=A0A4D9F6U6_9SAUR|nr:LON peptidase N-terminal domain and RING finger protein 1 [Platysternon megacephalum]
MSSHIVQLHNFRDQVLILDAAKKLKGIRMEDNQVSFFKDYSRDVHRKKAEVHSSSIGEKKSICPDILSNTKNTSGGSNPHFLHTRGSPKVPALSARTKTW